MPGRPRLAPVDTLALRTRVRTLRVGVWPSVFSCGYIAVYASWTREGPHRSLIMLMCAVAIAASVLLARAPIEPLLRGRWREPFFLGWSTSTVVLVTLAAGLDGGVSSPIAIAYFLPLAYASLSYPLPSMVAVAIVDLAGFFGLALVVGDARPSFVFIFSASLVAAAWICAWQSHDLDVQRCELARASRTDPLTGALNRRGFEERLDAALEHARVHGHPAALVLLDLDHFKQVNDAKGHAAGDELLCWVVTTLQQHIGLQDTVGRLGGDEFALILDEAPATAALTVERLRAALGEHSGVSAGVATFPLDGDDLEALHHAADAALYSRKQGERQPHPAQRELSWAAALASCVDERMAVRHEHSQAVADYAAAIAEAGGWSADEVGLLRLAATLHDVGKIHVPEAILRKAGPLTEAELATVARHPAAGADMVARIDGLEQVVGWIRHSHERIDGRGYPDGLAGGDVPQASRILLVADAYDAMISDRPYRRSLTPEAAVEELRRHAGSQFDAGCVAVLEGVLRERGVLTGPRALHTD